MEFTTSRPDIVRSINQRWLLQYWNRLRAERTVPMWQGLDAQEFAAMAADLSFTDVVGTDSSARFLIRYHGQRIAETYGAICEGKFLDEILPAAYREAALSTYRQVLASTLPVYTVADLRDAAGRIVHYERLLLPFSRGAAGVDRILASLETVSPEGSFEHRELMKAPPRPPALALCTTIQH